MGGVPKFYGHDPPIAALLVLGMIAAGARCDRDEDLAAAPRDGTEKGATREDRELSPRGSTTACIFPFELAENKQYGTYRLRENLSLLAPRREESRRWYPSGREFVNEMDPSEYSVRRRWAELSAADVTCPGNKDGRRTSSQRWAGWVSPVLVAHPIDSASPPTAVYGHSCEKTYECPKCFRISEYCEELASTIHFAIGRVELLEGDGDHLQERVKELQTELTQARAALRYTPFETRDDEGTPLTRRGMQPMVVDRQPTGQVYRTLPPRVPEFVYVVGPAPEPLGRPRTDVELDARGRAQFTYHPRHIAQKPGVRAETVLQRARAAAGRETTEMRAQYHRVVGTGLPLDLEQQIRFAHTLIKSNSVAQPIIVHLPVVNYIDGINHTRIVVDTREKALSMASFHMFRNENLRQFIHTPYVHYPFEMTAAELATHDAEVDLQLGSYNFHSEVAIGLTHSWKHTRIVLSVTDLVKLLVAVDMETHIMELDLGGNSHSCRFYWYCEHLYRSPFQQDQDLGQTLAKENVRTQMNWMYGLRPLPEEPYCGGLPSDIPVRAPRLSSQEEGGASPEVIQGSPTMPELVNGADTLLLPGPSPGHSPSTVDTVILTPADIVVHSTAEEEDELPAYQPMELPPTPGGLVDISEEEDEEMPEAQVDASSSSSHSGLSDITTEDDSASSMLAPLPKNVPRSRSPSDDEGVITVFLVISPRIGGSAYVAAISLSCLLLMITAMPKPPTNNYVHECTGSFDCSECFLAREHDRDLKATLRIAVECYDPDKSTWADRSAMRMGIRAERAAIYRAIRDTPYAPWRKAELRCLRSIQRDFTPRAPVRNPPHRLGRDRDEDLAAAPRDGTEKGATREDRELSPRGSTTACMLA
ncbi:hypothetical protein V9T40_003288 [Parthenolecanium corni]|uniref:Uncharacterized protein n=1 Tax=Parthenolecanium corni TaxID=536013 RepID=A0AAN9Y9J3_9HEMI